MPLSNNSHSLSPNPGFEKSVFQYQIYSWDWQNLSVGHFCWLNVTMNNRTTLPNPQISNRALWKNMWLMSSLITIVVLTLFVSISFTSVVHYCLENGLQFCRQNAEWRFRHERRSSAFVIVVHHQVNSSNISRIVWPRITKFYRDIHTNLLCSHTGYDITSCFGLAVKCNYILHKGARNRSNRPKS